MKKSLWFALLILGLFLGMNFQAIGSAKYTKETGKKCKFCHTGIPKKGTEDPLLNEDGETFKENNHQLTEEQKAKTD